MSNTAWNDLYFRLWTEAAQSRGTVTKIDNTMAPESMSSIPEWPRTTGADVVAIALLIDPILVAMPLRPGGYGITRLWQSAVIDLEATAFAVPTAEYPNNHAWWSALLAVASYLDSRDQSPPSDEDIEQVFLQLWSPVIHRNDSTPDADEVWTQQRDCYAEKRGVDVRPASETGSIQLKVPRTTNADVVRIYEYWSSELTRFLITGRGANTMGLDGQLNRWTNVRDAIDAARKLEPDEVYAKNATFWAETLRLATNLGVWKHVPSRFSLAVDATTQAVKDLPHTLTNVVGTVAKAAGTVAREVGSNFIAGLGKPLLIGGAAVVGLLVVLRLSRGARPAEV